MNSNVLLYGRPEAMPEQIPLRAGPFTLLFENGDLRYIKLGAVEVVRRIYAAARDRDWGTAPNALSDLRMDIRADAFDITFTCTNRHRDIDFVWRGELRGTAAGAITCVFDGTARADFLRARLGFCVLHPITLAGTAAQIVQVNGARIDAHFPRRIAPQHVVADVIKPVPSFEEMRTITCQVTPKHAIRLAFEGDVFEMEDQRNWTDGSFKTYCTPLRLPWPVAVTAGTRVRQALTLTASGRLSTRHSTRAQKPVTFRVRRDTGVALPQIGLSVAPGGRMMSSLQIARLRALKPAHLRVDLPLWDASWRKRLTRAAAEAAALRTPLEIALFMSDNASIELTQYAKKIATLQPAIARHLIFDRRAPATPTALIALARSALGTRIPLVAGTNKFFTELNRNRPDAQQLALLDGLCYSFNPQVHAFDNTSLAEAPEAQAETIRSCAAFAKGIPVIVSGITLKARHSLGDNGPEPREKFGEYDPRQSALFGAAWTAASLGNIARSGGAASITLYETSGPRGVFDTRHVFPLYHVLADVMAFGGRVLASTSSDALKIDGIVLTKGTRTRMLLANLTAQPQRVALAGAPSHARVSVLDSNSVENAMAAPETWRTSSVRRQPISELTLAPYAVVRLDA